MAAADEAILKRVLPHSIEAEQSVIGSMIMDREAIVVASEIITGEDFYNRQYGVLFETMVELNDSGRPVDLVTLQDKLREKDVPPEISSLEFIRDLITAVPTSANVKYYAGIVAEKSTLRKLIRLNEEIANTCYAGTEGLEEILETTEKKVFDLVQRRNTGDFVPIRQVVMNAMDRIEKASRNKGNVTGIPTGFIDLDYKTAGLQPSDLILIAARPSMGKTAFVLNIAQNVAFKQGMTVAMFSLEMSKEQFVNRLFSLESKVDSQHLRTGNLTDAEWESLIESAGVIGKSNLIIDDTPGITIAELRSKCRKYKLEYDLKLIIIDYLQLMSGSGGPWRVGNADYGDMGELAAQMRAKNVRPGIWFRPLYDHSADIPAEWRLERNAEVFDISVPEVLEHIAQDIRQLGDWGYELIKHDFSTYDIFGCWGFEMGTRLTNGSWRFHDHTKTTAELIVRFYEVVHEAAKREDRQDVLILGCNCIGHLGAGLMQGNRTGDDTSGVEWERTRKMGINTLAFRMLQQGTFYGADADCVGITEHIDWNKNRQWMEVLAESGTPFFVSVKPGFLNESQKKELKEAYRKASQPHPAAVPLDWMETKTPEKWQTYAGRREYNF